MRSCGAWAVGVATLLCVGSMAGGTRAQEHSAAFVDATAAAGLEFTHVNGAFGDKWMPESLGSGVALFDADGDDLTDILLVQGDAWPGHVDAVAAPLREATMRLFRNRGDGTFDDVTVGSGLDRPMYGFGAAAADYDGDGRIDLYVTAYGPNRLFQNQGGGHFSEVTEAAGVGHAGWGTSAAWFDYDRDGDLDLYAANYVRWSPDSDIWCTLDGTAKSYCTPESYEGEPSVLYRNEGDGTFVDATREAQVFVPGGKSLGVTVADVNQDGWPDFAVSNDTEPNFLFQNRTDGTFEEVGLISGMAFDATGRARAGMGIDTADVGNDGSLMLAIGNFSKEMIGLFELAPGGLFIDASARSGVGRSSFPFLTFGLFFFDYDLDGWLDMFAANGHLEEHINDVEESITYAQRPLLYHNEGGGRFVEIGENSGAPLTVPLVGRGAAYADLDRDGDLDVVVTTNGGPALLLRNLARDVAPAPAVVRIQLQQPGQQNRQAIGATVRVRSGDWQQQQMVRTGSSYASQSELVLTFGLGAREVLDRIEVSWPSGEREHLSAGQVEGIVNHQVLISKGHGIVETVALSGPPGS